MLKPSSGAPDGPILLLVEDDPTDQRLLRVALRGSPLEVDVAAEAESAIAYLTRMKRRPLLVLSDIHLPGLSGWDLLAWVRARPELDRLPVLLWTSLPNPEGKERALRQGAAGYVGKPRDLDGYRRMAELVARLPGD